MQPCCPMERFYSVSKILYQPQSGNEMPRFAGRSTMMRLPAMDSAEGLDAAFIGVPLDIGTSLRAGTRFGVGTNSRRTGRLCEWNFGTMPMEWWLRMPYASRRFILSRKFR